jgi:hypothetical protein
MVKQGAPLLIFRRLPKTVAVRFNIVPLDQQQITIPIIRRRPQLDRLKTRLDRYQRPGFCHRRYKGRRLPRSDLQYRMFDNHRGSPAGLLIHAVEEIVIGF